MKNGHMHLSKHYVFDEDLVVLRECNGIRLAKPSPLFSNALSVNQLFNMAFPTYFYAGEDTVAKSNEINANQLGYTGREVVGLKLHQLLNPETSRDLQKINFSIMKANKYQVVLEKGASLNNEFLSSLSFKFPWYGENNKVLGVFGLSLSLSNSNPLESISQNMQALIQTGLLTPDKALLNTLLNNRAQINLSDRQREIAMGLVRGRTVKQVANQLMISPRTVEHQIEKMKIHFNVFSKSALIEKLFDYFIP